MDRYCEVYIQTDLGESGLEELIGKIVGGRANLGNIEAGGLDLSVRRNKFHDPAVARQGIEEFMRFPFYLEVLPEDPLESIDTYLPKIEHLLAGLRAAGASFATGADFEDRLIDHGAYPPRKHEPVDLGNGVE
jgi:hypothetical protein